MHLLHTFSEALDKVRIRKSNGDPQKFVILMSCVFLLQTMLPLRDLLLIKAALMREFKSKRRRFHQELQDLHDITWIRLKHSSEIRVLSISAPTTAIAP